jgi:hypothetical protein
LAGIITAQSADRYRIIGKSLSGLVSGMEFGDGVHWSEVYEQGGALRIISMGRRITGQWRIVRDQLCKSQPDETMCCYEVWRVDQGFEQRADCGLPVLEGVFSRP